MAEGTGAIYDSFKGGVMGGLFDLDTAGDTIKLTLHDNTFVASIKTHTLFTDTTGEYGAGSGYAAGGETLGSQTVTTDTTNDRGKFDGADVTWTSLGPLSPATPSACVLWADATGTSSDYLIAYWNLGTTATNGGDYTIQWGTNGIILLT